MATKVDDEIFLWTAYKAYVLLGYYKPHAQPERRITTFHAFLKKLCHELVGDYRTTTQQGRRRSDADPDVRLSDVGRHMVERADHATTNNRCTVCSEKYRRAKLANLHLSDKDQKDQRLSIGVTIVVFFCALVNQD